MGAKKDKNAEKNITGSSCVVLCCCCKRSQSVPLTFTTLSHTRSPQPSQAKPKPKSVMSHQKKKEGGLSETALKRKEHAERVLHLTKQNAEEKKRLIQEPEFICIPQFQNNLPRVPTGPFFRTVELPHSFEDFGVYTAGSSLERSYVWQPHKGPDVGLHMDFVDQEKMLNQYQKGVTVQAADKVFLSERKNTERLNDEKLTWLRETIYSNNDLYNNTNKFKGNEDMERGHEALTKKLIGEHSNPFSNSFIGLSFDAATTKTKASLEKNKKKDGNESRGEVEWVMPLLPSGDDMWGQILSLVQFETGTLDLLEEGGGSDDQDVTSRQDRKRRRVQETIVTNIRVPDDDSKKNGEISQSYEVSLTGAEAKEERDKKATPREYAWKRELKMNIKNKSLSDHFILVADTTAGVCEFCPVRSKIEMHKPNKGGGVPHGVSVRRRQLLEQEVQESARLIKEIT